MSDEVKSFRCNHVVIESGAGNFECKDCYVEKLETLCKDMAGALEKTYETIKPLDGYDSNFFRASDFESVQDAINLLKQALEKFKEVMK